MSSFWNEERVAALRTHCESGLSASQIAALLGCTRGAVIGKIFRGKGAFGLLLTPEGRPSTRRRDLNSTASGSNGARGSDPRTPARGTGAAPAIAAPVTRQNPVAADPVAALVPAPMAFEEAVDRGRCLFFAGDPLGPNGPDMPVCGNERAGSLLSRYCARHLVLQMRERIAA